MSGVREARMQAGLDETVDLLRHAVTDLERVEEERDALQRRAECAETREAEAMTVLAAVVRKCAPRLTTEESAWSVTISGADLEAMVDAGGRVQVLQEKDLASFGTAVRVRYREPATGDAAAAS